METINYYLKEFQYFDGYTEIIFNIVDINFDNMTITLAITNQGKISVIEYDLKRDKENNLYFEYGCQFEKIAVDDFENIVFRMVVIHQLDVQILLGAVFPVENEAVAEQLAECFVGFVDSAGNGF